MGMKRLCYVFRLACDRLLYLISVTILLTFPVYAEEEHSFRLLLPDPSTHALPRWKDEIVIGTIGADDPDLSLFAISQVVQWANWAGTSAVYYRNIFDSDIVPEGRKKKINYLIHFGSPQDLDLSDPISLDENTLSAISGDMGQSLTSVLMRELQPISKGCFVSRASEGGNVLLANVISVHTSLSEDALKTCLDFAIIASFGLYPSIVEREYFVGESQERIVVDDYSNPIAFLSSAAACMNDAGIYDPQCAVSVANGILSPHSQTVQ